MARFVVDPKRLNFTVAQRGKEYNLRLIQRGQTIFSTLLDGLASNYISAVQGPNYSQALKAVAIELARLELALEDVSRDVGTPRSDFLWSIVGYLVLVNSKIPDLGFTDEQFRSFFADLIRIYFQGAIPASMQDIVTLLFSDTVSVTEDFLVVRNAGSGGDISNQFTFGIDYLVPEGQGFPSRLFDAELAIRQLLDLVRPAHTLFKLRFVFQDNGNGGDVMDPSKRKDEMTWQMGSYYYDDARSFWSGIKGLDRLGRKVVRTVTGEAHTR